MNSTLNVEVSCFKNYNTPDNPKTVNLIAWLTSNKYASQQEQIQNLPTKDDRDQIKATLPAITPSGVFTRRGENYLICHSGFLQFDIDLKENQHIGNYSELKAVICNIVHVAYCALSVSGTGFWGLIAIAYPEMHKEHFEFIRQQFAGYGIVIDPAPKNVASLRGYSYDSEAYFNHSAVPLENYYQAPHQSTRPTTYTKRSEKNTQADVEALINELTRSNIDITEGYKENWLRIGFAIAAEFSEDGRQFFHDISRMHPKYNQQKADHQYNNCLHGKGNGVTIGTLFHLCKEAGVILPKKEKNQSTFPIDSKAATISIATPISMVADTVPVYGVINVQDQSQPSIEVNEGTIFHYGSPCYFLEPELAGVNINAIYLSDGRRLDVLLRGEEEFISEVNDQVKQIEKYYCRHFVSSIFYGHRCLVHLWS